MKDDQLTMTNHSLSDWRKSPSEQSRGWEEDEESRAPELQAWGNGTGNASSRYDEQWGRVWQMYVTR